MNSIKIITLDSTIVQNQGNIVSDMDGEKVMLSVINGKYYNLGEIGSGIWDILKMPIKVNQLTSELMNRYFVEKVQCQEQVILFLEQLYMEGLINITDKNG